MRLAFLLLVLLAHVAHADEPVRDDIVDLRHDRWPYRHVLVGWTADDRAVVHAAECFVNDGGGPLCSSRLDVIRTTAVESVPVLQPVYVDPFMWSVPTELASQAIRTERSALAKLGTLQPSATGPLPQVSVRVHMCDVDVVIGKKRVPAVLALGHRCDSEGGSDSFQRADVVAVRLSPDRLKIAVTLRVRSKSMEWFGLSDVTKVLDATP
jgi:hypothetical protein